MRPFARRLTFAALVYAAASTAPHAYDLNAGRLLASNCTQCHATNVLPKSGGFDSLKGKSYSEIYGDLKDLAQESRYTTDGKNGVCTSGESEECLMGVHVMPYTDQQLRDIAYYLSQP